MWTNDRGYWLATLLGAVAGGVWGWLYLTDERPPACARRSSRRSTISCASSTSVRGTVEKARPRPMRAGGR